jgi:hypothetical protein
MTFEEVEVIPRNLDTYDEHKATWHNSPHSTTPTQVKGVNSHRWLDSTMEFASEMVPFWNHTVNGFLEWRKNMGTPERVEKDVVIALIDDGVDRLDTAFTNQVLDGKSFDFHDEKLRPPFSSARGHGTVMASMILRICPMAKVYPIRLKMYETPNGNNTIDANYAAQVRIT